MLYDVWFRIEHPANIVVEASSKDKAKEIAEELLCNMDDDELMNRLIASIDFCGLQVVDVEEI